MSTPPGGPHDGEPQPGEPFGGGRSPDDQAEAFLAQSRAAAEQARARGSSFGIALALAQGAQALLALHRPEEALADLEEAQGFLDLLRSDGEHERMRLLSIASLSLAPPGEQLGDLDTLEAFVRIGRAGALEQLGRVAEARAAVAEARPWVKGWGRRPLRKALDAIDDRLARATGTGTEALAAAQRAAQNTGLPADERQQARYEQAALLAEQGRYDEAIRAALMLLRDCEDDPGLEARVRQVLGAALAAQGRDDDALTALTAAFEGFAALGEDRALVMTAPGLASRLSDTGQHARAVEVLRRAITSARILRARRDPTVDAGVEADLLGGLATTLDQSGDTDSAIATFAEAVVAAEQAGDAVRTADARHGEAVARARSVQPADAVEALALLDSARVAYETTGMTERAAGCAQEAGALLARLGSFEAARARYLAALSSYDAMPQIIAAEVAPARSDCAYNLAVLSSLLDGTATSAPVDAFTSGGHGMRFGGGSDAS